MKWLTYTEYIDVSTGEVTRKQNKKEIIIIKTTKTTQINETRSTGYIKYQHEYRRHPQQELPFNDE